MYNKEINLGSGLNNGYLYFLDKEHPLAYKDTGIVLYHRHIMSLSINRWITTLEQVHHIDGNKLNNLPDNLIILSASEHSKLHADIRGRKYSNITLQCNYCNVVVEIPWWDSSQKYCSDKCRTNSSIKRKDISKDMLNNLIPKHSWMELGNMFGYSDNGIKKRAQALGCDLTKAKYKHKGK